MTSDDPPKETNVIKLSSFREEERVDPDADYLTLFTIETDDPDALDFSISFDIDGAHMWQGDDYFYLTYGQVEGLFTVLLTDMARNGADNDNEDD